MLRLVLFITCLLSCNTILAQSSFPANSRPTVSSDIDLESGRFLAEIRVNSAAEVEQALKRAEQLFEQGAVSDDTGPAVFVLNGPEAAIFLKENYQQHKAIVDLAARLSAFQIVDIRVCEVRLGLMGYSKDAVHPFVGTVPFGPDEIDRLLKDEHYHYF